MKSISKEPSSCAAYIMYVTASQKFVISCRVRTSSLSWSSIGHVVRTRYECHTSLQQQFTASSNYSHARIIIIACNTRVKATSEHLSQQRHSCSCSWCSCSSPCWNDDDDDDVRGGDDDVCAHNHQTSPGDSSWAASCRESTVRGWPR